MGLFNRNLKKGSASLSPPLRSDALRGAFASLLKRGMECAILGQQNPELRAEAYGFIEGLRVTGVVSSEAATVWKTQFHTLAMEAKPLCITELSTLLDAA